VSQPSLKLTQLRAISIADLAGIVVPASLVERHRPRRETLKEYFALIAH
jgi:hypothetical protein